LWSDRVQIVVDRRRLTNYPKDIVFTVKAKPAIIYAPIAQQSLALELLDLKSALLEPACRCPAVQHSKRLVRVSLIANTGRTTSYKAFQNSKIMIV
jgi:hypothetical protein